MLWLKAFHVISMVTWFAGLFYLPRLFVYHADATDRPSLERFAIMERRLLILMTIGGSLTALFGVALLVVAPGYLALGWLRVKLVLVAGLIAYHWQCFQFVRGFATGRNSRSSRWYRGFNEIPSLLLIAIVILVIVKPF